MAYPALAVAVRGGPACSGRPARPAAPPGWPARTYQHERKL